MQTYSNAYWSGPAGRSQGSADNGLGTPQVVAADGSNGAAAGTKYYVMDGSSGVVKFDLQVSSTITAVGRSGPYAYGSERVQAQTAVIPQLFSVKLNVQGTTKDTSGADNILIGQGCNASLSMTSTGYAPGGTPTLQNYQWNVSGSKFASFFISADQSSGHVNPCDPVIWTTPNPQWYWYDKGDGTVSGTATVIANGQSIGTIQDSKPITVWVPYSKMGYTPSSVSYTAGQAGVVAQGPNGSPPGMTFVGSVGTPDMFLASGAGNWCFMQMLYLDRVQHVFNSPIGIATNVNSALDGSFPYSLSWAMVRPLLHVHNLEHHCFSISCEKGIKS